MWQYCNIRYILCKPRTVSVLYCTCQTYCTSLVHCRPWTVSVLNCTCRPWTVSVLYCTCQTYCTSLIQCRLRTVSVNIVSYLFCVIFVIIKSVKSALYKPGSESGLNYVSLILCQQRTVLDTCNVNLTVCKARTCQFRTVRRVMS